MVEQRLKQVVVLAIDQGDLDGCLGESFRGSQAAEPGANNDHVRPWPTLPRDTSPNRVESDA